MKVLAFILAMLVSTGLAVGGVYVICGLTPDASIGAVILASTALSVLTYGPLMLGSVTAYFDVRASSYSRRTFRLWLIVIGALEVASGVCIVAYAVLAGAPVWVPVVFIGTAIALTAISLGVGRWIFKRDRSRSSDEPWSPVSGEDIRRMILIVALTFVIGLVIAMVTLMLLARSVQPARITPTLVMAVAIAFFAAAFACSMVTLKLQRRLRTLAGHDLGQTRKLTKAVIGRKPVELDDGETVVATKFAVLVPTILGFQVGSVLLLYVAIILQQAVLIAQSGLGSPFFIGIVCAMVAMLALLLPLHARRIGRAREYVKTHADLLPSTGDSTADSVGARSDAPAAQGQ